MNDKELLELAAKAVGIEHPGGEHSIANDGRLWDCNEMRWWNPLTDDGDAFRLAVKLNIRFARMNNLDVHAFIGLLETIEPAGADHYAATRRAITRAAAEIVKNLGKPLIDKQTKA